MSKRTPTGNIEWTKIQPTDIVTEEKTHFEVNRTHVAFWGSKDAIEAQIWLKKRSKADAERSTLAPKPRIYVGHVKGTGEREVFKTATPTAEANPRYAGLTGPFRTWRGAAWMAHPVRGTGNPHCVTVSQAERLAKRYEKEYNLKTRSWMDPAPMNLVQNVDSDRLPEPTKEVEHC